MASWSSNKTHFDVDAFRKLVARFDSSYPAEAETAFRKALSLCVQTQVRFQDAVTEAFGNGGNSSELDDLEERVAQRERQGAALAEACEKLEREFASYRRKAEKDLAQARRTVHGTCQRCEWKRAALAVIAGGMIAKFWFGNGIQLPAMPSLAPEMTHSDLIGMGLTSAPLLGVLCRWQWTAFKRRFAWVSGRDNDLYRRMAVRWNKFLQKMTLK